MPNRAAVVFNKNRLCLKTCGMDMNAEKKKIRKYMKNQKERSSIGAKIYENIFKMKF